MKKLQHFANLSIYEIMDIYEEYDYQDRYEELYDYFKENFSHKKACKKTRKQIALEMHWLETNVKFFNWFEGVADENDEMRKTFVTGENESED